MTAADVLLSSSDCPYHKGTALHSQCGVWNAICLILESSVVLGEREDSFAARNDGALTA